LVINIAFALFPPADAVIVAEPALYAVTDPVDETVATELSELDHSTIQSDSGWPLASFAVAVNVSGLPTLTLADGDGETTTVSTGTRLTCT
jgi:hypothetical protein